MYRMSLLDKIYIVEYIFQASDNYDTVTTKVMKCAINNVESRSNLQICLLYTSDAADE